MENPDKNISHVIFGSYEIKAWYPSPYVLDGLVRPDTPAAAAPLRLNGGSSAPGANHAANGDGYLTDSTDIDDSMQQSLIQPESSTSRAAPTAAVDTSVLTPVAGPSVVKPPSQSQKAHRTGKSGRQSLGAQNLPEENVLQANIPKSSGRKEKAQVQPTKLYVCEGCFKYMVHPASYAIHVRSCKLKHPPGRKVYQKGAHTIWEIDGEVQKLYCQNLCLFGKLFIDHKYVFFETSGFLFYVLTEARPSFDHVFGFFSKEKISYNDYNLACIVTFPPYQRRGFGTLLIEFSYELSSRSLYSRRAGTPERPLSDLGLRGYLQYWTSVLVRYFRLIFYTKDDPRLAVASLVVVQAKPGSRKKLRGFQGEIKVSRAETLAAPRETRRVSMPSKSPNGRLESESAVSAPSGGVEEDEVEHASQGDHNEGPPPPFEMQFSLAEIANATDLREDDVAFTLVHSGLANLRAPILTHTWDGATNQNSDISTGEMQIVITTAVVEAIGLQFKVKPPVLSKAHCLF